MFKNISILGSTGSIGTQALDVASKLNLNIRALTAYSNIDLLEQQIRKFRPSIASVFSEEKAAELKLRVADTPTKILPGMDGLIAAAVCNEAEMVLNSVVGMVGLTPTLSAIKAGKHIALANKETLVAGGKLVMDAVKEYGVNMYPVDSEHSAIFQCLQGMNEKKELKRLILTASGGPFFGKTVDELKDVTVEQALNHPNWSMGAKITIDSASMMNKGLEIIEASWLFDMPASKIDVLVHRESVVHSLIEFVDNSVIAQLGVPDMRIPIQYAITYPSRYESPVKQLDLADFASLTFGKPDYETFTCLSACKRAIELGGTAPAIANGANEVANKLFRDGKIKFLEIGELVTSALDNLKINEIITVDDVINADKNARQYVIDTVN
ncbi:MAG: 1-deoxy-D-xylulose-5-phosphate reductoisomerase [Ruminococcus sp.]|nr:1-deoxy-D-xylulose-5-phosphate reductoisomerase [Ruminococcus sp.]